VARKRQEWRETGNCALLHPYSCAEREREKERKRERETVFHSHVLQSLTTPVRQN
jgi:hypothetical protein